MKIATYGYVPPPRIAGAESFYDNIRRFKTTHPLVLFSDHPWQNVMKLRISPEVPFSQGKPHKFAINNVLWYTALQLARLDGYTHMLYLESDCRVGREGWDGMMYDEFFNIGRPLVAGGSLAVYNPMSWNRVAWQRWQELVATNQRKNMPVATYGWKPMKNEGVSGSEKYPSCVFPNGALAIYNVEWMHELFDLTRTAVEHAMRPCPFDMEVGNRVWEKFEEDAYEVLGMLSCSYSGYGNVVTTEQERRDMLTSGKICAMHQEKTDWKP